MLAIQTPQEPKGLFQPQWFCDFNLLYAVSIEFNCFHSNCHVFDHSQNNDAIFILSGKAVPIIQINCHKLVTVCLDASI